MDINMVPTVELAQNAKPKRGRPKGVRETKPRLKKNEKQLLALRAAAQAKKVHDELRELRLVQNKVIRAAEKKRELDEQLPANVQTQLQRFEGDTKRAKLALSQQRFEDGQGQQATLAGDAATQRAAQSRANIGAVTNLRDTLSKGQRSAATQRQQLGQLGQTMLQRIGDVVANTTPAPTPAPPTPIPPTPAPKVVPPVPTPPPKYSVSDVRSKALRDAGIFDQAQQTDPATLAYLLRPRGPIPTAAIEALDTALGGKLSAMKDQFSPGAQQALSGAQAGAQAGSGFTAPQTDQTGLEILRYAMDQSDQGRGGLAMDILRAAHGSVPESRYRDAYSYVMQTHQYT